MDSAKILFIFFSGILFFFIPLFIKNVRQYFLGLASSLYVFSSGWIFYRYNGLMFADLPILGLLILGMISSRRFRWTASPISLPVLGIVVWGIVSSFGAIDQGWALSEVTKYVRMYLLIICLVHHIQNMKDLRIVLISMLTGLLFQVLLGIYQWRFGTLGIWFLGERLSQRMRWRTMGTFFVPSFYANYLTMLIPVAFRMFVYYKSPDLKWTIFYGANFLLGTVALLTTYGRGPWIALSISIVILILITLFKSRFKARMKWTYAVLLLFSLAFSYRYGSKILGQFGGTRHASYEVRFPQFRIASRIIRDNYLLGVGLGNYEFFPYNYMTAQERRHQMARVYASRVHNSYYLMFSELGIPGGVFLLCWFGMILVTSFKILKTKLYHSLMINLTLGILGGMIAIMVVFTFSPDIHAYQILYQISIFSGVLMAEQQLLKKAEYRRLKSHQNSLQVYSERSTG